MHVQLYRGHMQALVCTIAVDDGWHLPLCCHLHGTCDKVICCCSGIVANAICFLMEPGMSLRLTPEGEELAKMPNPIGSGSGKSEGCWQWLCSHSCSACSIRRENSDVPRASSVSKCTASCKSSSSLSLAPKVYTILKLNFTRQCMFRFNTDTTRP